MIKINNKEYQLKRSIRASFLFEQITNKPFELRTVTDEYTYYYCVLLTSNPDCDIDFKTFLDAIDESDTIAKELSKWLLDELKMRNIAYSDEKTDEKDDKKKV